MAKDQLDIEMENSQDKEAQSLDEVRQDHEGSVDEDTAVSTDTIENIVEKDKNSHTSDAAETTPLRETEKINVGEDAVEKAEGDEECQELTRRTPERFHFNTRCVLVGVLMLSVIVIGALAGILTHRLSHRRVKLSDISFGSYFGDGMVLQRSPHKNIIWGYGPDDGINQVVTVTLEGFGVALHFESKIQETALGSVWKVVLDPITDKGPYTIRATLADEQYSIQLSDVIFGDVWLCAGEGNMQLSVSMLPNATEELQDAANYADIRLFSIMPHSSHYPWYDVHSVQLPWSPPSQESLAGNQVPKGQMASYFSALCWLYGKHLYKETGHPIGLVEATNNQSMVEAWLSPVVLDSCPQAETLQRPSEASAVWNGMIQSLVNMTIKGIIWYQGETNALQYSRNYNCTFPALIKDWREKFRDGSQNLTEENFPFGFVQLGPHREGDQYTYGFSDVRWQQLADYGYVPNPKMPNVFMASAIDLPDPDSPYGSMHPQHQRILAQRLADACIKLSNPQTSARFGLRPLAYQLNKKKILTLRYETPIEVRSPDGFEVCCSESKDTFCQSSFTKTVLAPDREWLHTPILSNDTVELSISGEVCGERFLVGVRYAWRETPCEFLQCGVYEAISKWPALPYIHYRFDDDNTLYPLDSSQEHLL